MEIIDDTKKYRDLGIHRDCKEAQYQQNVQYYMNLYKTNIFKVVYNHFGQIVGSDIACDKCVELWKRDEMAGFLKIIINNPQVEANNSDNKNSSNNESNDVLQLKIIEYEKEVNSLKYEIRKKNYIMSELNEKLKNSIENLHKLHEEKQETSIFRKVSLIINTLKDEIRTLIENERICCKNKNNPRYTMLKDSVQDVFLPEENIINIDKKPDFDICCVICLGMIRKPITCYECDNAYCTVCIEQHLKISKKCPSCKKKFHKRINRRLNICLNPLIVKCPLECGEELNYRENYSGIEEHYSKHCKFNKKYYKCTLCMGNFEAIDLEDPVIKNHNELCPGLKFDCDWCKDKIRFIDKDKHMDICRKRFIRCESCHFGYPNELKRSHDEFYCKFIKLVLVSIRKLLISCNDLDSQIKEAKPEIKLETAK